MPYVSFVKELSKVGLSVGALPKLIGMSPNSISNYARAEKLPTHLALIVIPIVGVSEAGGDSRERSESRLGRQVRSPQRVPSRRVWSSEHACS